MGAFKPDIKRGDIKQQDWEKKTGYAQESFTAEVPSLYRGVESYLSGVLKQSPNEYIRQILGGPQATSQRAIEQLLSGQIGGDIVPAIQNVAAQNLTRGSQMLQQQGARFSGAAGQQIADLTQRVGADTALAVAQAKEAAAGRRMNELLGAGQMSNQLGQVMVNALQTRNPLLLSAFDLGTGPAMIKQEGAVLPGILSAGQQLVSILATAGAFGGGGPSGGGMPQVNLAQSYPLPTGLGDYSLSGGGFPSSVPGAYPG